MSEYEEALKEATKLHLEAVNNANARYYKSMKLALICFTIIILALIITGVFINIRYTNATNDLTNIANNLLQMIMP